MTDKQTIYDFSEFRVDTANKILRRGEIVVPLTPKVFDTLVLLLENAPNLVEKNVLMDKLWHNQFVEESNITFNIKMLRKALGDEATNPKFIETVPRRGYRFIAKLNEYQPKTAEKEIQKTSVFQKRYLLGLVLLIVFASLIGFAAWNLKGNENKLDATILATDFKSTKLTETGKVNHAVISPDGKYLAYTNEVSGKQSLWLRQLSGGTNTEILPASNLPFYGLTFSHDSENIFFTRRQSAQDFQLSIFKIPIFGGVPSKIVGESQGEIAVLPDDKQIVFARYEKDIPNQNKLVIVDIDGKNERVIKSSEAPHVFWTFAVSPDGKKIMTGYGHTNNASKNMKLAEIDLATGEQQEVAENVFFQISSLVFLDNQYSFLFSANEKLGESSKIWLYNSQKKEVVQLTNDSSGYGRLSINKSGDKLVATTLTADFGLFVGGNPNSNKYLTQARDGFAFTPDGKIVYAGDAAGSEDIWIMDENGSNQKQLTTDKSLDGYPIVSADNQVYFTSNRTGENQIWRMNLDGSNQTQLTRNGGKPIFATPDGKWIYYESAINQIVWKVSTTGSEEVQLFPNKTGFYQAFSRDGLRMAYLFRNKETKKFEIAVISLETQKIINNFPIPEGNNHPYFLNWTTDGEGLTYSMEDLNGDDILWLQSLSKTSPKFMFNFSNQELMDCRLSPNGKNYFFIRGNWKHDSVLISGLKY